MQCTKPILPRPIGIHYNGLVEFFIYDHHHHHGYNSADHKMKKSIVPGIKKNWNQNIEMLTIKIANSHYINEPSDQTNQ